MIRRILRQFKLRFFAQTLSSKDAYALWSEDYPPYAHNPLMQAEQGGVLQLMPELKGRAVLDLACGTGRYGLIALERGASPVIGLDSSLPMLRKSAIAARIAATTEYIPLMSEAVDVIICGLALGHLRNLERSFREMSRVLRPGGLVIVSDFHPLQFQQGNQRTFKTSGGQLYVVEHYRHSQEEYKLAGSAVGFVIENILEKKLAGEYQSYTSQPVAVVYRFIK